MRGAPALLLALLFALPAGAQPTLKPSSEPLPPLPDAPGAAQNPPAAASTPPEATPPAAAQAGDGSIPALQARVTDTTGTLDAAAIARIEAPLVALERAKGSQIAVLMVSSTGGESIESYAVRAFEQWKLGRAGVDDGILLVVARDDRAVRIEVGYGLEGAVPDGIAYRIIQEYLVPHFRAGDFAGGIEAAVGALARLVEGEQLPAPMGAHEAPESGVPALLPLLVMLFFLATVVRGVLAGAGAGVRGTLTGAVVGGAGRLLFGAPWWLAGLLAMFGFVYGLSKVAPGRYANRGSWGGFGGGGSWGGGGFGGGGGGWSGGGGRSGGGGASGSW
jgi:uncharacterized protein